MRLNTVRTIAVMAALSSGIWHLPALAAEADHLVIARTAHQLFGDLPKLEPVADVQSQCGADEGVNPQVAFCTSRNVIFYRDPPLARNGAPGSSAYELAHVFGHAVQVRHGVADVALRTIMSRRAEEAKLRGWVTRQVECIAGFIYAQSGLPSVSLNDLYDKEPMTASHWGRNPLAVGPKVSIGLEARAKWFKRGLQGELSDCAVGEFGAELLLKARR